MFCYSDKDGSFLNEIPAGPVAYISEALDYDFFALETGREVELVGEPLVVDQLFGGEEDSETCGLRATPYASLVERLASADSCCVDVLHSEVFTVGVFDPVHLLVASTHIGTGHVDAGADELPFGHLESVGTGQEFQLSFAPQTRVYLYASLRPPIRQVDYSILDSHQTAQRLHLLHAHMLTESGSSLRWQSMMFVLSSI